jgi:hypothetical protein
VTQNLNAMNTSLTNMLNQASKTMLASTTASATGAEAALAGSGLLRGLSSGLGRIRFF